jgi:hypothetical protein
MKKIRKARPVSAEGIARLADQGKDISCFFKGQGRMVQPAPNRRTALVQGSLSYQKLTCAKRPLGGESSWTNWPGKYPMRGLTLEERRLFRRQNYRNGFTTAGPFLIAEPGRSSE